MSLGLFMMGIMSSDMEKSVEFYRRLGLDVPEENGGLASLAVRMEKGLSLLLTPTAIPLEQADVDSMLGDCRVFFEYYLQTQSAVEAKYAELVGYGYSSYRSPFHATVGHPKPLKCALCWSMIQMAIRFCSLVMPENKVKCRKLGDIGSPAPELCGSQ